MNNSNEVITVRVDENCAEKELGEYCYETLSRIQNLACRVDGVFVADGNVICINNNCGQGGAGNIVLVIIPLKTGMPRYFATLFFMKGVSVGSNDLIIDLNSITSSLLNTIPAGSSPW